jgi:hypothetical protein
MEEPREQHYPVARPQLAPPNYPIQPQPYYMPWSPPQPGRWQIVRRTLRLLLRRSFYWTMILGKALRPFAGFVVMIVALLALVGWMGFQLWWPKADAPAFQHADLLPPTADIERFIKGQQSFDANLMWDTYSPSYQANQLQNGASKETLQADADSQRQQGLHFVRYNYVGGVKLDAGGGMYFYAVDVEVPNQHAKLAYIFTADDKGKIVKIISPLNN